MNMTKAIATERDQLRRSWSTQERFERLQIATEKQLELLCSVLRGTPKSPVMVPLVLEVPASDRRA